jgi:hypothetical protein
MPVPNLADEIERKSNEAMTKLLTELSQEQISYSEFYCGIRAIWDTASGLISQELMGMLAGFVQAGPGDPSTTELFSFDDPPKLVAVRTYRQSNKIETFFGEPNRITPMAQEFPIEKHINPRADCRDAHKSLVASLEQYGKRL